MAEPLRFSPEELDRIEDALELLEDPSMPALADPSPQVRDILEAYREILVASREAMPMEDVPLGALAAVFAEAEASVAGGVQVAAAEVAPPRPGFWTRVRKAFLIPSVALAGTAALVLLMNWTALKDESAGMDRAEVAVNESPAKTQAAAKPEPSAAAEQQDAAADDSDEQSKEEEAKPAEDAPAAAPPPAPGTVDAITTMPSQPEADEARKATNALDPLGDVPEPEPAIPASENEKTKDSKKDAESSAARWDLIERADRARQDGDCAAARPDYMIATEDDDAGVRARAYAGLGLCNMQAGDDAGAEDAFERARGEDETIEKFIKAERKPSGSYSGSTKKKPVSKSKKAPSKKAVNMDQASDPFSP